MKDIYKNLIDEAKNTMENAYVPYSHFSVGAAVLAKSGKIYTGCNVENATFGATCCAERVAIFSAVAAGERDFAAIAIISSGEDYCYPCGICRQVIVEFSPEMEVICGSATGGYKVHKGHELLPHYFTLK